MASQIGVGEIGTDRRINTVYIKNLEKEEGRFSPELKAVALGIRKAFPGTRFQYPTGDQDEIILNFCRAKDTMLETALLLRAADRISFEIIAGTAKRSRLVVAPGVIMYYKVYGYKERQAFLARVERAYTIK